jgi:hypothetical protein
MTEEFLEFSTIITNKSAIITCISFKICNSNTHTTERIQGVSKTSFNVQRHSMPGLFELKEPWEPNYNTKNKENSLSIKTSV